MFQIFFLHSYFSWHLLYSSYNASCAFPTASPNSSNFGLISIGFVLIFFKGDSTWKDDVLGSDSTICKVGCLMSSVSMALKGRGKTVNGQSSNPRVLNNYLRANSGYYGNLFIWGAVAKFGFSYVGIITDINQIKSYICQNKVVILNVKNGNHW